MPTINIFQFQSIAIIMSIQKPSPTALFFIVTLSFIQSFKSSNCIPNNNVIFCPEIEKEALVNLKQSLSDPFNKLSSWNKVSNCCNWKGVVCSNFTGHVHEVHLQNYGLQSGSLGKAMNPHFLNLKHLRYLDLSLNFFEETIPSLIGSLTSLKYLDLSNAGFHGTIPHTIGNLSNLSTLSLETDESLDVDSLQWLLGLSQLEHLNMNGVNMSKVAANWVHVVNTLPSLVQLHFKYCSLNSIANIYDANVSSSLAVLDLSDNHFHQPFVVPRWIFQLSNLIFLDLSFNPFQGPIPSISNTTKLKHIDLSWNNFNSTIPDWLYFCKDLKFASLSINLLIGTVSQAIANFSALNTLDLSWNVLSGKIPKEIGNLCSIRTLDLSNNKLQGEISDSFGNVSNCFLGSLEFLSLRENLLSGHVADQFGEFKSLQTLDLSSNLLSSPIPANLGRILSLEKLTLNDNKLTGTLPESLGQLFNLEVLDIAHNMLEGVVTESHFANLRKLNNLHASGNHLTLKVNSNWTPPFQLEVLQISSWNIGVDIKFFSWLEMQKNVWGLDLSNSGISGLVPSWVWRIPILNLSHNHLHGNLPNKIGHQGSPRLLPFSSIYLSSNEFSGSLPRVANSVTELDLSNNLFTGEISHFLCDMTSEVYELDILHLGGNQLTGELPNCWIKWPSLKMLNLGNNNFFGSIPSSIGTLAKLQSLNLYNNKFCGQIPFSMHNCTKLVKIDLAGNNLEGNLPTWIGGSLHNLRFLILFSNQMSGKISSDICHLKSLQILDLSDNKFSGIIPRCVGNFTAMATKRSLSWYDFVYFGFFGESASIFTKGRKFEYDTILSLVTSFDLSHNNLSGDIPKELTSLVELRSLNLSVNHLTGSIPDNIGDMKQLESLDFSRNTLSGRIPYSFKSMSSLNHLNLSCNNLTGKIPESTQLLGFDASSFVGNKLCGPPLVINCRDRQVPGPVNKGDHEGGKSKIKWFYVFLSSGFTTGFLAVCTILILSKSWRDAYFELIDDMWSKLYVCVCIKWRNLARR